MMDGYDVAQICLKGHVINATAKGLPVHNTDFCNKCGAATIIECPECKVEIRGRYHNVMGGFRAPAFCHKCGKPYPWTKLKIEAAHELAQELDQLTPEEKEMLSKSIDDIVTDSPRTTLGATRFKKIMAKVGKEAAAAFKEVLVDVASEAAKKMIWSG
jgi:hypothetical protein